MRAIWIFSSLLSVIVVSGCGGGNSEEDNPSTQHPSSEATSTGYFVDAPVEGLSYRTHSQAGKTDTLGRFEYLQGENVTFSIGATELGSAPASALITPGTLDKSGSIEGNHAINVARLLITLDADQNPENGITIDTASHKAFSGTSFDLSQDPGALDRLAILKQSLDEAGREGLVSVSVASKHLEKMSGQLPSEPTDASIRALMDHGINYSGRQSPITLTPDNQRKAAQVFWSDPDTPGLDFHSLRQWVEPQLFHDLVLQHMHGYSPGDNVSISGTVESDGSGGVKSADVRIMFNQYQNGPWVLEGVVDMQMMPDSVSVEHEQPGEDPERFDFAAHDYDMTLTDLRFSRAGKTYGVHGDILVFATTENPDIEMEYWTMNLVLRQLNSERTVKIQSAENTGGSDLSRSVNITKYKGALGDAQGLGTSLHIYNGVNILHWEHGAYRLRGSLYYGDKVGEVDSVDLKFSEYLDSTSEQLGIIKSANLPESTDIAPRVRSEVLDIATSSAQVVEVYPLSTPLERKILPDLDPVWVFDEIVYKLTAPANSNSGPEQIIVTLPPLPKDPDGESPSNTEFSWVIDSHSNTIPVNFSSNGELVLKAPEQVQETLCIQTRATYSDVEMIKRVAIDLQKETGIKHRVSFEDAPCVF